MYIVDLTKLPPLHRSKIYWDDIKVSRKHNPELYQYIENILITNDWDDYNFEELYHWCKSNCSGHFGFNFFNSWFFDNKNDSLIFSLTWR